MSLSPKIKSIFFIIATFDKMEYKFKNGAILKAPKKLVIAVTNPLVFHLIVEVSYVRLLLITKLIFMGIKFEVFGEASYTYNGSAKSEREIKPS